MSNEIKHKESHKSNIQIILLHMFVDVKQKVLLCVYVRKFHSTEGGRIQSQGNKPFVVCVWLFLRNIPVI